MTFGWTFYPLCKSTFQDLCKALCNTLNVKKFKVHFGRIEFSITFLEPGGNSEQNGNVRIFLYINSNCVITKKFQEIPKPVSEPVSQPIAELYRFISEPKMKHFRLPWYKLTDFLNPFKTWNISSLFVVRSCKVGILKHEN